MFIQSSYIMSVYVHVYIVSICILGITVLGLPVGFMSYIENINVSYDNEQWVCGGVKCPSETFGCRVQQLTDVQDNKMLHSAYTCLDEAKIAIKSANASTEMTKRRKIDINLESYVGAESVYSVGYGLGGHENAQGTISPSDWNELKESAKSNMKAVEDSNAHFE